MRNEPNSAQTETRWHPATKFLLAAAVLAIPYLWWTRPEPESAPAAPAARTAEAAPPAAEATPASLEPYALPPLERFAAVVERPLFSPTRRMPPIPEPSAEPQTEPVAEAPPEIGPSGPAEPDLRFFGTVSQAGQAAALVTFPATNAVARLKPGDHVDEWEVLDVARNRLVLGAGEERRTFEIFGPSGGEPSSAAPSAGAAPDAIEPDESAPDESVLEEPMPHDVEPEDGEPPDTEPAADQPMDEQ